MTFVALALSLILSSEVNANALKGTPDCEKENIATFNSVVVEKVQRASGITNVETKIDLENHYFPQMSRPSHILVNTKRSLKEIALIHSNRKIEKLNHKKLPSGDYQFKLPEVKKFQGKIQLIFKDKGEERCERNLTLEELSP